MKKEYISPELEEVKLSITKSILADSQIEDHDSSEIGGGDPGEF